MSKITGIKVRHSNNTQSEEIPFGVSASNVEWDSSNTLVDVIEDLQEQAGGQQTITGAASTIVSDNLTASRAVISNASGKVAVSDVTSTELGYLDGVTSNVQTQLNEKQATVTGAASTVVSNNLTGNRVLKSNGTGKIVASSISSVKLDYLLHVDSDIQYQFNEINSYLTWQSNHRDGYRDPQDPEQSFSATVNLESGVWTAIQAWPIEGPGMCLFLIDAKFPANGTGIRSVKVTLGDTSTQLNPWAIVSEPGSANADTTIKMIVPVYLTWQQVEEVTENQSDRFYIKVYQDSGQTMYNWAAINVYKIFFRGYVPEQ